MNKIKCECGHVNPHGTILCEACGKSLEESEKEKTVVDMRYEGSASRSKTYKRTMIDKIWNFFSSVKVGGGLIVITLVASALGTIFPQESNLDTLQFQQEQYYEDTYGTLGNNLLSIYSFIIYTVHGGTYFSRINWGILVICSLDRFFLYIKR